MRKLSKYEKETIINWNEAENLASVYTFNASLKRRLADFSRKYPLLCRLERSTLLGSRGNAHWRVEGSRPIGSRVKRLAQGELMPASTRTGYYLTQNSQDLRLRRPFPGPRTSSQEGGNLFETDTTQWALRQAWHL